MSSLARSAKLDARRGRSSSPPKTRWRSCLPGSAPFDRGSPCSATAPSPRAVKPRRADRRQRPGEDRRSPATSARMAALGAVIAQFAAGEVGQHARRLRAPKGRLRQGPSRGHSGRRRRRRPRRWRPARGDRRARARSARSAAAHARRFGAACGHSGAGRRSRAPDELGPAGDAERTPVRASAAAAGGGAEHELERRARRALPHRPPVLDHGKRDRPFGVAGEEGARAVDRIDHEDALARQALVIVGGLLRQPAIVGPGAPRALPGAS